AELVDILRGERLADPGPLVELRRLDDQPAAAPDAFQDPRQILGAVGEPLLAAADDEPGAAAEQAGAAQVLQLPAVGLRAAVDDADVAALRHRAERDLDRLAAEERAGPGDHGHRRQPGLGACA